MKYAYYTEEELILDESFQNWVRQSNAKDIVFWNEWLLSHPQYSATIENARQMLLSLDFSEMPVPDTEVRQAWTDLQAAITQKKLPVQRATKYTLGKQWYRVAAILILVAISGAIYWLNRNKIITFHTSFGQTASISLPDGSQVTLNGNTTLQYPAEWSHQHSREVWLDGEAFFAVAKKNNAGNAKFIVHIPDMDVEVLGTKFNVYHRKQKGRIVLNCGQVKVKINKAEKAASVMMKPGDLIELSEQNNKLIRKKVNPEVYSSWKNNRLIFDNTSLAEIGEMIESTYGKKVIFQDADQSGRKLTGTIPTDNLDILIMTLSKSFNLSVIKNENQLTIKSGEMPRKKALTKQADD